MGFGRVLAVGIMAAAALGFALIAVTELLQPTYARDPGEALLEILIAGALAAGAYRLARPPQR